MKTLLLVCSLITFFSFCKTKQLKQDQFLTNKIESNLLQAHNGENGNPFEGEIAVHQKDTSIMGVAIGRIDSIKRLALNSGGLPESDTIIAQFLKLSDSVRIIGPYSLRYNGRLFVKSLFNKKHPEQLDSEISEERKGIVSIQNRMQDKPDYYPLLEQRLEFYNSTNKLIRSFDINKNNPFLRHKSKRIIEYVYPPLNNISEPQSESEGNVQSKLNKYHAYNHFHVQSNGYVIVEYQLYGIDKNEKIVNSTSTLVVLDSVGSEYVRFANIEDLLNSYWMVSGGKYLMVNGGGFLGEGFQKLEKSFIKIFESSTKKLIYKEELKNDQDEFGDFYESEYPYKISVNYGSFRKTNDKRFTELIFDPDMRMRCSRTFSKNDLEKITNERIKYSGNVWLQKFKFDCKTF